MDIAAAIIEYETGNLSEEDTIKLFQVLVDNGMAWSLQGHYGRIATAMLELGVIERRIDENKTN